MFLGCQYCLPLAVVILALLTGSATASNNKVSASWYGSWHADANPAFQLSKVSWTKYTHVTYAFAETAPDVHTVSILGTNPEQLLPSFVSTAHQHGVKALISIGGWTGSRWWSSNVATAENRTAFVQTVVNLVKQYDLDGLDFDWEYPVNQGIGCNTVSPNDTSNFLSFIQELRQDPLGSKLILTAATATVPFADPDGNPLQDISGFAEVLTYIAAMNYDIWGPWSPTVGPNSPLNDTCAAPENQVASAVSAVAAWTAAGMPLDKIVLGVASYGHSFAVSRADAFDHQSGKLALAVPFNASKAPQGDSWDGIGGIDECGNFSPTGGSIDFWGLIQQGYLSPTGHSIPAVPYIFDTCSQTPFVYNTTTEVMISFDDARSFAAKGQYIKHTGLRGFAMWETGGDYNDILLDSILEASGICP